MDVGIKTDTGAFGKGGEEENGELGEA